MTRIAILILVLGTPTVGRAEGPKPTEIVRGNNRFALDLYGKLRQQPDNLFLSPYSLSTALAMSYAGARGETAEQMAKTLHFSLPAEQIHSAFAAIGKNLSAGASKRGYRLNVANRLWGQRGYDFVPGFLALTRESYGAELAAVDFARQSEQARRTMNVWVEQKTQGKLRDLIRPGDLGVNTRLVLTNAIDFKGQWTSRFDKGATKASPFHVSTGRDLRVPMMHQTSLLTFLAVDGLKVVKLPYIKSDLAMYVLLPDKADGLASLESRLTVENLTTWLEGLQEAEVNLSFPRFTMTSRFQLAGVLKALGMSKLFTRGQADLSGISTRDDLFLADAIQEAFVEVNEEGTEAVVASAIHGDAPGPLPPPQVEFRADHPFVFLIQDKATGSILFLGRVVKP